MGPGRFWQRWLQNATQSSPALHDQTHLSLPRPPPETFELTFTPTERLHKHQLSGQAPSKPHECCRREDVTKYRQRSHHPDDSFWTASTEIRSSRRCYFLCNTSSVFTVKKKEEKQGPPDTPHKSALDRVVRSPGKRAQEMALLEWSERLRRKTSTKWYRRYSLRSG